MSLKKTFKNIDMDGNKTCTHDELYWGLKDYQIEIS